jgi:AcrR family transcriptional regulator
VRKGDRTRTLILNDALAVAGEVGLEGLSIGALAGRLGLSKSGLFAHFGSKEDLQLATLRHVQERFEQVVFRPALASSRGLPRLRAPRELARLDRRAPSVPAAA